MSEAGYSPASFVDKEQSLEDLAWEIEMSQGEFKLILARCNYPILQKQMTRRLKELCSVEIQKLCLKPDVEGVYSTIQKKLGDKQPAALMLFGLESVRDIDRVLSSLNQVREEFRKHCPFPLVLWVDDQIVKKLIRLVPDFESWATLAVFSPSKDELDELVDALQQRAESLFSKVLDADANHFPANEDIFGRHYCLELESALRDLDNFDQKLPADLEACWQFVRGRDAYASNQIDDALSDYWRSFRFWKKHNYQLWQGALLFHIGLCYYRKAELLSSERDSRFNNVPIKFWTTLVDIDGLAGILFLESCSHWQKASSYFQQCVDLFEQAQRSDLVAKFINQQGEVLVQLRDWEKLSDLAQKSKELHQKPRKSLKEQDCLSLLAQDYGFLAEVALNHKNWNKAKKQAQKALDILARAPKEQQARQGLYLLLLARSQRKQKQVKEAINSLEQAKERQPQDHKQAQVYIEILEELRSLYFEQNKYLKAFLIEKERHSIEQRFDFRAFIGAGRLKPRQLPGSTQQQATIADEIASSCQRQDVERLIKRIEHKYQKLTVIYGPSGVGKSSMVEAGLVPLLKQKPIGIRDVVPILLRDYISWVTELGKHLVEALENTAVKTNRSLECDELKAILARVKPKEQPQPSTTEDLLTEISEQLKQNDKCNLLTVLIFDQFEEFFLVYKEEEERKRFTEFFRDCLNIKQLKIILSLREDYLHFLLQSSRLVNLDAINNNILDKNNLYYVGNFDSKDAKSIILNLTKKYQFPLEPELVNVLVQDLTNKEGKVRPIELQVVGAQLETERIRTLDAYSTYKPKGKDKYQQHSPKDLLIQQYVDDVVKACGNENKDAAQLVLFLLTDEYNIRPLKSEDELERELNTLGVAKVQNLKLVLRIFLESELVVLLMPAKRYQLVHDYLVAIIRQQQQPKLQEVSAKLEKEKMQRESIQRSLLRVASLAIIATLSLLMSVMYQNKWIRIAQLNSRYQTQILQNQQLEALVTIVKAGKLLQEDTIAKITKKISAFFIQEESFIQEEKETISKLSEAIHLIRERNRLNFSNTVLSVSFSPDGETIATADGNTVKLWHQDGKPIETLKGHQDFVWCVSFSPDGQLIASASADNTVKLWRRDGTLLNTLEGDEGHKDEVKWVSFSPDSQIIASASADNTVKLWRRDGSYIQTLKGHEEDVNSVTFSPDGQMIASASNDNTVKLWSRDGTIMQTLQGHKEAVWSVTFSPDGKRIASASDDKTVKLWSSDGQFIKTLLGHENGVNSVSFSSDGEIIASASTDDTIKLWTGHGGPLITTLESHKDIVNQVDFRPQSKMLASASADQTVRLWNLEYLPEKIFQLPEPVYGHASFSPDGKILAAPSRVENKVILINRAKVELVHRNRLFEHEDYVNSVSFSPNGQIIASASNDKTVKLWNLDGLNINILKDHTGRVNDVKFSPDGQMIASASDDKTVKLWNLDGKLLHTITEHTSEVRNVSFSDNGLIASVSASEILISRLDGRTIKNISEKQIDFHRVSLSPNGKILAAGTLNGDIKIWRSKDSSWQEFESIKTTGLGHRKIVYELSFWPNSESKIFASASKDGTVKIWNQDGIVLATLKAGREVISIEQVNFTHDGETLFFIDAESKISYWRLDFEKLNKVNSDLGSLLNNSCNQLDDYLKKTSIVNENEEGTKRRKELRDWCVH